MTDEIEQKQVQPYPLAHERLSREQFLRVIQVAEELDDEATRCAEVGLFTAACAMTACALEAALLANVLAQEPDMERAGTWPPSKQAPENWHLAELVSFHLDQGWISKSDSPKLAEVVVFVNDLRNVLLHPGRLIREAPDFKVEEAAFRGMYGILQDTFEETHRALYDEGRT